MKNLVLAALIALAVAGYAAGGTPPQPPLRIAENPACNIKGNISYNTEERIYHTPGQKHYAETRISPDRGERWFCSEEEARRAGWRRSRI